MPRRNPRVSRYTRFIDRRSGMRFGRRGLPAVTPGMTVNTPRVESINQWHRTQIERIFSEFLRDTTNERVALAALEPTVSRLEQTLESLQAQHRTEADVPFRLERIHGEEELNDEMLRRRRATAHTRRMVSFTRRIEQIQAELVSARTQRSTLESQVERRLHIAQSHARQFHDVARSRVNEHLGALITKHPKAHELYPHIPHDGIRLPAWVIADPDFSTPTLVALEQHS